MSKLLTVIDASYLTIRSCIKLRYLPPLLCVALAIGGHPLKRVKLCRRRVRSALCLAYPHVVAKDCVQWALVDAFS